MYRRTAQGIPMPTAPRIREKMESATAMGVDREMGKMENKVPPTCRSIHMESGLS